MTATAAAVSRASEQPREDGAGDDDTTPSSSSLATAQKYSAFEDDLKRDPYRLRTWRLYLESLQGEQGEEGFRKRVLVYERALGVLPRSYKLWRAYLSDLLSSSSAIGSDVVVRAFERSLVSGMNKMPRIWLEYLFFLRTDAGTRADVTATRRCFDRALRSLPAAQHERIWAVYLEWVNDDDKKKSNQVGVPTETGVRVYRRYLKLNPSHGEEYIAYLIRRGRHGEAATVLASLVRSPNFSSLLGKTKHQLWLELCDLVTQHPDAITSASLNVDAILRSGINKFKSEVGRLWTSLADYYIRKGMFEVARDTYTEGLGAVMTVRDFSLVYDAFARFEETMIAAKMEEAEQLEEEEGGEASKEALDLDLDLRLCRLDKLMESRPELLNAVVLRQNPNNVQEWLKRVKIFRDQEDLAQCVQTFLEAVKAVDPPLAANGKYGSLWVGFAKFYEQTPQVKSLEDARSVFRKATTSSSNGGKMMKMKTEDLASVWCEWAEMEVRHRCYREALEVMRLATSKDSPCRRSQRAWMLLGDLTESLGSLQEVKAAYGEMLDLKIATPQVVLNFAKILEEKGQFEEAFKAYERGCSAFRFPHSQPIWKAYLAAFVARYKGTKVERSRELFRQAIEASGSKSATLYLQYASFEESYGLSKNVMTILASGASHVPQEEKMGVYSQYLKKASDFYGVAKVRSIYQQAIEEEPPVGLDDEGVKTMCLRYAGLEKKLGEIDRARAIIRHGSQLANPKQPNCGYWDEWRKFEEQHGNEETFREMLRCKRSVAIYFSEANQATNHNVGMSGQGRDDGGDKAAAVDKMAQLEEQATALPGFVRAETVGGHREGEEEKEEDNPEDIDIDIDDDDDDADADADADAVVRQKAVPDDVFGSLKRKEEDGGGAAAAKQQAMGAMERFKRARTT